MLCTVLVFVGVCVLVGDCVIDLSRCNSLRRCSCIVGLSPCCLRRLFLFS